VPDRVPPSDADVHDLEVLLRAHHPLVLLETDEVERAGTLVRWVADRTGLPFVRWRPDRGLSRPDVPSFEVEGSDDPVKCLEYVLQGRSESLFYLENFSGQLEEPRVVHKLVDVALHLFEHRGAVLIPTLGVTLPRELERIATVLRLRTPTNRQYYDFARQVLRDLKRRMPVRVDISGEEVGQLVGHLQGLTFFEVKKILTKVIVEDGGLSAADIPRIAEAKKEIVERSGVLEYFSSEETMREVAGLTHLKQWLQQRKLAFTEPLRAKEFGLTPPRGILLLGVQGCGKSLCAKAIAREWGLPLIRLDPSNLYNKFFGESEKNLKRATQTAEAMAPIVLWIDEIEKAFAQGGDQDSGTSSRIFGTFLNWMQEKKEGVFVVATSNDITKLPPELVRKGRFDEIFFVDLPDARVREHILAVHLLRRGRDPRRFDLAALAARMDGFSGAEIEQVVLSGLYSAFSRRQELNAEHMLEEVERTVPLSVTAAERIEALRSWARDRAVPAG
jgi:AAA+ superfamily predicted ATPase